MVVDSHLQQGTVLVVGTSESCASHTSLDFLISFISTFHLPLLEFPKFMKTPSHSDDSDLLALMRMGDHHAFEVVYNRYATILAYKLTKLIKIRDVAQELHQEAFARLWDAREQIQPDTNLKAYLYTITRNLAIDFYRKAARRRELENQLAQHVSLSYDHIEPLLSLSETAGILEELIGMLPAQRQRIFRLVKQEGKTYEEASVLLGISINTVKDHMRKSTLFLKNQLTQNYPHITYGLLAAVIFQ